MVEKHDIVFKMLHKFNAFDPIRDPETSDIMLILLLMFFSCPRNCYNDYNKKRLCVVLYCDMKNFHPGAETQGQVKAQLFCDYSPSGTPCMVKVQKIDAKVSKTHVSFVIVY